MVPSLLSVTILIFLLARLAPVDTVNVILGETGIRDPEVKEQIRERLGITGSIPEQYLRWGSAMLRGDFGESWFTGRSIGAELKDRIPVSLELGVLALLLSLVISVPIGLLAAIRQDSWMDYVARGGAILMLSIPSFWFGIIIVGVGYYFFTWAPPAEYKTPVEDPETHVRIMMWPILVLGLGLAGTKMRLVRSSLLEVLRLDYIRTARAKGLTERKVLWKHAMRNALIPVVTIIGLQLPFVVAGSVVLENIFLIPGIGRYFLEASTRYDFPITQAIVILVAGTIMVSNLIVDLSYAWLDPQIHLG